MFIRKALIVTLVVLLNLTPQTVKAVEDDNLEYKKWYVESIGNVTGKHLGHATFESGNVKGVSTCNIFFGVYDLKENNKIKFFRIGVGGYDTKSVCAIGNKMELEEKFIDGLETVATYKIEDNKLTFYTEKGEEFTKFYLKTKK